MGEAGIDEADLELLRDVVSEAGRLALRFFRKDPKAWKKAGDSPVSEADIAVDLLLMERLRAARPDYGWLSEESVDDPARLVAKRVFIADPIDGTREFLAGKPGWAVAVAVVEAGRPRAGMLASPALGETFTTFLGGGAFRNGRRLQRAATASLAGIRIAGPRSVLGEVAREAGVSKTSIRYVGALSRRVAMIASGELDLAVAKAGALDWDLAAADLLVHEAGGVLTSLRGAALSYNRPSIDQPAIVAGAPAVAAAAGRIIALEPGMQGTESGLR